MVTGARDSNGSTLKIQPRAIRVLGRTSSVFYFCRSKTLM